MFVDYHNSELKMHKGTEPFSDGETLKATLWLNVGINNYTDYSHNYLLNKINYGMLIDADSNTETGYRGADNDFYIELSGGNLCLSIFPFVNRRL